MQIENAPSIEFLRKKHSFEKYLLELEYLNRNALCNLRTGNHKLPISKLRYTNDANIDVNCLLCESDEICDEFHVLFNCKYFEEKRKQFMKKFYYTRPNTDKMNLLFNSNSPKELQNLGKFSRTILSKF